MHTENIYRCCLMQWFTVASNLTKPFLKKCQKCPFIPHTLLQPNRTKAKFTQHISEPGCLTTFPICFHVNLHAVVLLWQPVLFHLWQFKPIFNSSYTRIHEQGIPSKVSTHHFVWSHQWDVQKTFTSKGVDFFNDINKGPTLLNRTEQSVGFAHQTVGGKKVCLVSSLNLHKTLTQSYVAFLPLAAKGLTP